MRRLRNVTAICLILVAAVASAQSGLEEALRAEAERQTASIRQGGRDWPILETRFFLIRHQSSVAPDPVACRELDAFVARTLEALDASGETVPELQEHKLSYYLCDDDTVEALTGYVTKGMADLSGRAVISSHFPHFHELAHLLVDIVMADGPPKTHPLVQEGIACLLGGRWGRAPATILYTGWVHDSFGMGELADVLTSESFFSFRGGADVAYPLGAMLCEVVRREAGWRGVLELYDRLSGTAEFVSSLKAEDVLAAVSEICGWNDGDGPIALEQALDRILPEFKRCGIAPTERLPRAEPDRIISSPGGEVRVWREDHRCRMQVRATAFPVYLLSPADDSARAFSPLFGEHLPAETYRGQRYGLRCTPGDIVLYDFATNQLLATWVAGFTDEVGACGHGDDDLAFELSGDALRCLDLLIADGCGLVMGGGS